VELILALKGQNPWSASPESLPVPEYDLGQEGLLTATFYFVHSSFNNLVESESSPNIIPLHPDEPVPDPDDIKIEYHPSSGLSAQVFHFDDYKSGDPSTAQVSPLANNEPWKPFRSRLDFEFAEVALQAALNKEQTDTLIRLMHSVHQGHDLFTLSSHGELTEIWGEASKAYFVTSVGIKFYKHM
jgi:hypothetical protein